MPLIHALYNLLLFVASPAVALYLALIPRHRPLRKRFRPPIPPTIEKSHDDPIWIHAASLGEVNTAAPIITELRKRYPEVHLVLSTSTRTGMDQAQSIESVDAVVWFPFDHPWSVSGFLHRLHPRVLILIETELWPNVLRHCHQRNIPVVILNGRVSEKHYARNLRIASILRPLLKPIRIACVQTQADAQRLHTLGLLEANTHITGNTKFDGAKTEVDPAALNELRSQCGIHPEAPVLIFGSTRPGDEAIAMSAWTALRDTTPQLRLIIAPRHLTRLQDVLAALEPHPVLLRSQIVDSHDDAHDSESVIVVDTMGELSTFYALAEVAVVGGSFSSEVQGHNPIEPAALGIATVFGPHMKNFQVASEILTSAGGAVQVHDATELAAVLQSLFSDEGKRSDLASAGRQAVQDNLGAIQRSLDLLESIL